MDLDSPRPIYVQIIDEIKRAVARRQLQPGDRLPSQREMAQRARVNPNTVQRAFREMEVMGLVETARGQGTFIRNDPALLEQVRGEMAQAAVSSFVREMAALGFGLQEAMAIVKEAWQTNELHSNDTNNAGN
ncbi:MAG: GntR family transcriptional regulator [Limnochordaceae bacterium]|nr:GntR family transcriptional regulator [Limnochordaceae bacterium]